MIAECKRYLLASAEEWGLPTSGTWRALFYNNYHPHIVNLDLLWFHERERFPRIVTKLCAQQESPKREFENLRRVYAGAGEFVPKPLHLGQHGGLWGVWMAGVPGSPFQPCGQIGAGILQSMAGMVAKMHRALMSPTGISPQDRYRRMVSEPLRAVAAFGASAATRDGCQMLETEVTEEWLSALPVIPQHGDLYAGNLIYHADRWYAIDFESYGTIDLPLYDLLTLFLSILGINGEPPEAWNPALAWQMSGCIREYCQKLGLANSAIRLLLPLVLVNWFFVQWSDGREKFSTRMYKTITDYFERTTVWEEVFGLT